MYLPMYLQKLTKPCVILSSLLRAPRAFKQAIIPKPKDASL